MKAPPNIVSSMNPYQLNGNFEGIKNSVHSPYSSGIYPNISVANELTLEMQNTF